MELIADRLVALLAIVEQKLADEPARVFSNPELDIKHEDYHDLLRSNAELDKRIKQQIAEQNKSALMFETVLAALHEASSFRMKMAFCNLPTIVQNYCWEGL